MTNPESQDRIVLARKIPRRNSMWMESTNASIPLRLWSQHEQSSVRHDRLFIGSTIKISNYSNVNTRIEQWNIARASDCLSIHLRICHLVHLEILGGHDQSIKPSQESSCSSFRPSNKPSKTLRGNVWDYSNTSIPSIHPSNHTSSLFQNSHRSRIHTSS